MVVGVGRRLAPHGEDLEGVDDEDDDVEVVVDVPVARHRRERPVRRRVDAAAEEKVAKGEELEHDDGRAEPGLVAAAPLHGGEQERVRDAERRPHVALRAPVLDVAAREDRRRHGRHEHGAHAQGQRRRRRRAAVDRDVRRVDARDDAKVDGERGAVALAGREGHEVEHGAPPVDDQRRARHGLPRRAQVARRQSQRARDGDDAVDPAAQLRALQAVPVGLVPAEDRPVDHV